MSHGGDARHVVLPQLAHNLGDDQVAGVRGEHAHDEHAVVLEIGEREVAHETPLLAASLRQQRRCCLVVVVVVAVVIAVGVEARRRRQCVEMASHEPELVVAAEQAHAPGDVVGGGGERQHAQPEPHEDVDDLVEEVDAQHALHRPVVRVAHLAYLEVAEGDARKVTQLVPLLATQQHADDLDAERVVVVANERVEHEQLTHRVGQPQRLHEHVQDDEVVAEPLARPEAHRARPQSRCAQNAPVKGTRDTARLVLFRSLRIDITVVLIVVVVVVVIVSVGVCCCCCC